MPNRNSRKIYSMFFLVLITGILLTLFSTIYVYAAASGTHKPVTGVTVGVSGATDNSMSNGAVTVTAKGSGGILGFGASAKTATITVTNDSGATATVSFDWTATSVNQLTIDSTVYSGTSGSFSKVMDDGASITITITTAKNGTTNKLVMGNFAVVEAQASSEITFTYNNSFGNVTVGGEAMASGGSKDVTSDGVALVATPKSGTTFLGWIDSENKILSSAASFTLKPASDMSVTAVFASASTDAWFNVDNTYLVNNLKTAVTKGKLVVLANDGTLPVGDYTIPTDVTLLIPFDSANTLYTTNPGYVVEANEGGTNWSQPTFYRTLTMASGANITVNGAISLSAKHSAQFGYNGMPIGNVSRIHMNGGSSITVSSSGKLYAWGYITGSGVVTAKSGSTVYENFQLKDWRGGSQTTGMKNNVFPMSQYYIQNIEVPLTIESGAKAYGTTTATLSLVGNQTVTIGLFAPSDALFKINSGSVTKDYLEGSDQLYIELNGNLTISEYTLKLSIYSINTKDFIFTIPGHFKMHAKSGSISLNQNISFYPGSELTIDSGATMTVGSRYSMYIYDLDEWGNYCYYGSTNVPMVALDYAPGRICAARTAASLKDAEVCVNGTLSGNVYTSESGAKVYSTENGTVVENASNNTTIYQIRQNIDGDNDGYDKKTFVPAVLQNSNNSTVKTSQNTYNYADGKWVCESCVDENPKDNVCDVCKNVLGCSDADGDNNHECDHCGAENITDCVDDGKDHKCDECGADVGDHTDANTDHKCDYGCSVKIGTCEDKNLDHKCDYGCSTSFGVHKDDNNDHKCDYGCSESIGKCEDADKNHKCDYGCSTSHGDHTDANTDHKCDYGCSESIGDHTDANTDHKCDYGCSVTIGACSDSDSDIDHVCDYGCGKAWNECSDAAGDNNHNCDTCNKENISSCVDENAPYNICDECGKTDVCAHEWNDATCAAPKTCSICDATDGSTLEHTDADIDGDHVCDRADCTEVVNRCSDATNDGNHACEECGAENVTSCEDGNYDHKCDECTAKTSDCKDDDQNHFCDFDGCKAQMSEHTDTDKDHACDYDGCSEKMGSHVDTKDKNHICDYGCSEKIGTCEDKDRDHWCDYGCKKIFDDHLDANSDHACDYGCSEPIGKCEDADKDHKCDHGCDQDYGTHEDTDNNHACDYGCSVSIGIHADADNDHVCNYGCSESIGTCEDADKDHDCDYGCDKVYGTCEDKNFDHACDYGCIKYYGTCEDKDLDHDCDYGCDKIYGEHTDGDKNHICNYGCSESIGRCEDSDKDHKCDYGCGQDYGTHEDTDQDHACDYGCQETIGDHADSGTDKDHVCDYGCGVTLSACVDTDPANNVCDICGEEDVCDHDYGAVVTAPTCTEKGYTTHTCSKCRNSYQDTFVDANGHTEGEAVVENKVDATCTKTGSYDSVIYCAIEGCGTKLGSETFMISKLDHNYNTKVTAPTCTEEGFTTYTCDCGAYYISDEVPATGHKYDANVTPPTCAAQGYTTHTCSVCTDSYVDSYVDATGEHNYAVSDCDKKETWNECSKCKEKVNVQPRTYDVTIVDYWGNRTVRKGYTYGQYLWLNYSTSNVLELQYNGWELQGADGEMMTVQAYEVWESFVIDENTENLIVYEDTTAVKVKYGAIMMSVSYDQANSEKTMTVDLFIYVDSLDEAHKPTVTFGGEEKPLGKIDDSLMMWFVSIPLSAEQITQGGTNVQITVSYQGVPVKTIDSVLIAYEKALEKYLEENVGDYAGNVQDEAINAVLNYGKTVQYVFGSLTNNNDVVYDAADIASHANKAVGVVINKASNKVGDITFHWGEADVNFMSEYSIRYKFTLEGADGCTPANAQLLVKDKDGNVLHNYSFVYSEADNANFTTVVDDDGKSYYSVNYPVPASELTKDGTTVQITLKDSTGAVIAESSKMNYGIYAYLTRQLWLHTEGTDRFMYDGKDKTADYVNMLYSLIELGEAVNEIEAMKPNQQ